MLPKLSLLFLFFAFSANAAKIANHECEREGKIAHCKIFLEGQVEESEFLYISQVYDRDRVFFRGKEIASMGDIFGREFQASIFPRIYSLRALRGESAPVLDLVASAELSHPAGIPESASLEILPKNFSLARIFRNLFLQLFSFALLFALCTCVVLWLRKPAKDGWLFPQDELRIFLGSMSVYLLLRHNVSELFVPLLWQAHLHVFVGQTALLIAMRSLSFLLLQSRFSDRSCIERSHTRSSLKIYSSLTNIAFLASLAWLWMNPPLTSQVACISLCLPLLPLYLSFGRATQGMEWPRVWKRSALSPLLFFCTLLLLPTAVAAVAGVALLRGFGSQNPIEYIGWVVMLSCALRFRENRQSLDRSQDLSRECRDVLVQHAFGRSRLQALCNFVAEEWGAARVTVISVESEIGLVLASAGPEAIPSAEHSSPRRLGPFLRRVCKHGHMLYAPVAEELGTDLQNEGLKHSSLAIPLSQEHSVRAVVCMMAEVGERIPPLDAAQLELLIEILSLEVLSAVSQDVAESKSEHLFSIARRADALAVERLDHWGHFHKGQELETRVVLGGDCIPSGPFFEHLKRSPLLGKVWANYRTELRTAWAAVATSFEFIPKDSRDDFWIISPKQFQNPLLEKLGQERVAALLAMALEKQSRAILGKEIYRTLGYCGVRLVCSTMHLRQSGWHGSAIEIDSEEFSALLELRLQAQPGTVLFKGDASAIAGCEESTFSCRLRPWENRQEVLVILAATADKKELRKMENRALEKMRDHSKKTA